MRSNIFIESLFVLAGLIAGQNSLSAYTSVVQYGDRYIAAGEGQRLDILSSEGKVLDCVPLAGNADAVATRGESLLLAGGGAVQTAVLSGSVLEILSSSELPVRGGIISLDADAGRIYALTDSSEIAFSSDGRRWTVIDFNEAYNGFYPKTRLVALAVGQGSVAVAGVTEDGRPALYTSSRGTVWSPREMDYRSDGKMLIYDRRPTGLCYDPLGDQFIMLCEGGWIFYVPACSHCNHPEAIEACAEASLRDMCPADTYDFLLVGASGFTLRLSR